MNAIHILFETDRFNLTEEKSHFINPCCFGEDLAAWLREKLAGAGVTSSTPGQEDWGWYLQVKHQGESYLVGVSGNVETNRPEGVTENGGEWRIMAEKKRSIWQLATGAGKISAEDPMLARLEAILQSEPRFRNIHREA